MKEHKISMMKTACIVCSGILNNREYAKGIATDCDLLIAADGGVEHIFDMGLKPQAVVAGMDSIEAGSWSDDKSVERIAWSPDKAKTTTELAVEYGFQRGCEQAMLLAAVGQRLDCMLESVLLVARYPGRVAIIDGVSTLVAVDQSEKCILNSPVGSEVSLIPFGPTMGKIRTKGLKHSLKDEDLSRAVRGLHNEIVESPACVCVSEGVLLVYIEHGDIVYEH